MERNKKKAASLFERIEFWQALSLLASIKAMLQLNILTKFHLSLEAVILVMFLEILTHLISGPLT